MHFLSLNRRLFFIAVSLLLISICCPPVTAQVDDITGGDSDPIKLFERGQNAHAKGDLDHALAFYEAAIKLRPEFPEAEYQRGIALVSLNRPGEAEKAFQRAIELRQDWPLPYSALANVLVHGNRDKEAEPLLRRALELGAKDYLTLDALAALRLRANDKTEAMTLARRATIDADSPASAWALRAFIERDAGDKSAAAISVERALAIDDRNVGALETRAELHADSGDYEHAIADLKTSLTLKPGDKQLSLRLARLYELDNKPEEMRRVYESIGYEVDGPGVLPNAQARGIINVAGTPEEIAAANSDDAKIARPALEKLIARNAKNAALLARLGEVTRTSDPQKSLESYAAANKLDPSNPTYAIGYAAALIQTHRFADAVAILRPVTARAPNEYTAHSNLATALFKLKQYDQALPEFEWMVNAQPERAMTYFYIAIAHDNLGEYQQALEAYEKFLARADAARNQLEIDKVNLRLPKLRDQIKRGQGTKKKS